MKLWILFGGEAFAKPTQCIHESMGPLGGEPHLYLQPHWCEIIHYMILWYWNNIINTLSMAPQWLKWSPSLLEACFVRNWIDCHAALLAKDTPCKSCGYQQRATWWANFWVDKFHDDPVAKWALTKTLIIYCIWLYNKPIQGISMNQSA